jgi:hypothetical protein
MPLRFAPVASFHRLRLAGGLLVIALLGGLSGCAMCCAPYDDDFGYTGGAWIRDNPSSGRVGSAFEPAGYKVNADEVSNSVEQEPTSADEPATDDQQPMATPEMMPEVRSQAAPHSLPSNMTSAPRLRRLQPYLPQN